MKMKQFSVSFLVLAAALLQLSSCKRQMQMPASNEYPMTTVGRTTKTLNIEYSASLKGCNDVDIYPQVSGTITQILVKEGARVKKGQTLFVINQVPYRASYENAKANVESAQASLATARMTLESKQTLQKEKVISNYDLVQARNSFCQAQATLAQAQVELTKSANDLSYTTIKSPVDGVAGMISLRVGALVSEQMNEPLITVSDDSRMLAYFSITEQQVLAISNRNGKSEDFSKMMPAVRLKLSDGTEYSQPGKIDAVSGLVDKQTGSVSVRATFGNSGHLLRSGSSATVIVPRVLKECIVVPQTATFEIQDKTYVYKVVNGKTKSTEILIAASDDGKEFIVEKGLKVGDVIISDGAGLVSNGVEVKAKK